MPKEEMVEDVSKLAEAFLTWEGLPFDATDLFHQETAFNQCYLVSYDFKTFLASRDIKSAIIQLSHYTGPPFRHAHPSWMSMSPEFMTHYVVLANELVYDFTYRQFDPVAPVPFVQTLDQLKCNWKGENEKGLW